jgi:hypothetical protein
MMFVSDEAAQVLMREEARPRYWSGMQDIEGWYASGALCPALEAYTLVFYNWGLIDGVPVAELPHFTAAVKRLAADAGVTRALERHRSALAVR